MCKPYAALSNAAEDLSEDHAKVPQRLFAVTLEARPVHDRQTVRLQFSQTRKDARQCWVCKAHNPPERRPDNS